MKASRFTPYGLTDTGASVSSGHCAIGLAVSCPAYTVYFDVKSDCPHTPRHGQVLSDPSSEGISSGSWKAHMPTLGLVLFLFAGGLFVSALNLGLALLLTAVWPRVRVTWRAALKAWLVNAIGLTVSFRVVNTWLVGGDPAMLATGRMANVLVAVLTATIVSFGVLRQRKTRGLVLMTVLALLAIPLGTVVARM